METLNLRWMVLVLATGCGGGQPPVTEGREPVQLTWLGDTPACEHDMDFSLVEPGGALRDLAGQQLQYQAMHASFQATYATLLARPVIDNPTAEQWSQRSGLNGEWYVEGRSMARGTGWGVLGMGLTFTSPLDHETRFLMRADVHYSPGKTVFEFDDVELEFGEYYLRMDAQVRGCDPSTGINFVTGAWVVDNQWVEDAVLCWRDPGRLEPVLERSPSECWRAVRNVWPIPLPRTWDKLLFLY